jgi:hypothetical protein
VLFDTRESYFEVLDSLFLIQKWGVLKNGDTLNSRTKKKVPQHETESTCVVAFAHPLFTRYERKPRALGAALLGASERDSKKKKQKRSSRAVHAHAHALKRKKKATHTERENCACSKNTLPQRE